MTPYEYPGPSIAGVITQAAWYVDAANGRDTNNGESAASALRTLGELERRLSGRQLDVGLANFDVYIDGAFPGQVFAGNLAIPGPTIVQFHGTTTELDSGTITNFAAMNPGGGIRAALTDATQDFSGYINKRIRLTSGANAGAIAGIGSLGGANTIANVTEFTAAPTLANGWALGTAVTPAIGDTYVIEECATSCDSHALSVLGRHATPPTVGRVFVRDVAFAPATNVYSRSAGMAVSHLVFWGCEFWCTVGIHNHAACVCTFSGCSFIGGANLWIGFLAGCATQELNCGWFAMSQLGGNSVVTGSRNLHDGNGTRSVARVSSSGAISYESQHRGFFNNVNGPLGAYHVSLEPASRWVLASPALFWGAAGNTVGAAIRIFNGASLHYTVKPTATGAVPGTDVILANAAAVAWAAVPAISAAPNNAALNVRQ